MSDPNKPPAWLPFSIAEAALSASSGGDGSVDLAQAWSYLLNRLREAAQVVESGPASQHRVDLAAGVRHLLVLLAAVFALHGLSLAFSGRGNR